MEDGDAVAGEAGSLAEEANGDDGVGRNLGLVDGKDGNGDDAKDDEADDGGGLPGVLGAAKLEAKEEHEGAANDEEVAMPVNGGQALLDGGARVMQLEDEDENGEGNAAKRQVDVEAPAPRDLGGEDAAENGPNGRGKGPDHAKDAKVHAAVAHGEEVGYANVGQGNGAAAADALDGAGADEHAHAGADGTQQGADPEDGDGEDENGLAAKDVGQLAPGGDEGGAGEQVGAADPDVAGAGVEVRRDGGHGGGDDGHVEGGEEEGDAERRDDEARLQPCALGLELGRDCYLLLPWCLAAVIAFGLPLLGAVGRRRRVAGVCIVGVCGRVLASDGSLFIPRRRFIVHIRLAVFGRRRSSLIEVDIDGGAVGADAPV